MKNSNPLAKIGYALPAIVISAGLIAYYICAKAYFFWDDHRVRPDDVDFDSVLYGVIAMIAGIVLFLIATVLFTKLYKKTSLKVLWITAIVIALFFGLSYKISPEVAPIYASGEYILRAEIKKDPAICDGTKNIKSYEKCIWYVARALKNPSICVKITDEYRRFNCNNDATN